MDNDSIDINWNWNGRWINNFDSNSSIKFISNWTLNFVLNVYVAPHLFLILPVTIASEENSFSKLKLIKTNLKTIMVDDRLSGYDRN